MSHVPFQPIAITGLSALFPQARSVDEFWRLILSGRDCMQEVPATHWLIADYFDADPKAPAKTYSKHGAFLKEVPFDPVAFGLPPNTLPATDIAQLLALLLARQVLEDCSGGQIAKLNLERTSVILGVASATEMISSMSGLLTRPMWVEGMRRAGIPEPQVQDAVKRIAALFPEWNENTFPGSLGNVVAGRVANRFNLGGTNCVTDAACASSLAALHMGIGELQLGTSDRVITGGVDALNTIFMYMCFSKTPAMSPSGHCRPFSEAADGTMMGEGGGMLALRRLEDAERDGDVVYAVIRGLGSSSDGRSKSVYAPRPEGQSVALQRCYSLAGYSPATVRLVEAHGTATAAGDLCEATALKDVFAAADPVRRHWCALGSVKSQIGHTKGAAGTAGLVKVALALQHRTLPPTANVDVPNPELGFGDSPLYLNSTGRPWIQASGEPRRGSVSSFGFGGTNFHVALEEYRGGSSAPRVRAFGAEVFLASAGSGDELATKVAGWSQTTEADFAARARSSQQGFAATAAFRAALVVTSPEELAAKTAKLRARLGETSRRPESAAEGIYLAREAPAPGPLGLVYLFPGQGSQSVGMAAGVPMHFEPAMAAWEKIEQLDQQRGERLCDLVYPPPAFGEGEAKDQEEKLRRTENAQPALGAVSLAYLAVLEAAGVQPELAGGHSFGEIPALHAAGVITADDCVRLSRTRGELMAEVSRAHPGAMTAVWYPAEKLAALLTGECAGCVIANYNSPQQTVVAGPAAGIHQLEERLAAEGATFRRLPVATAFHSVAVAEACAPLEKLLAEVTFTAPKIPVFNNTTAAPYPEEPAAMRALLAAQLAQPVRFADQLRGMHAAGGRIFLEVGAGTVLSGLARQTLGEETTIISLNPAGQPAEVGLLHGLARLAVAGVPVSWELLWDGYRLPQPEPKLSAAALPIGGYNLGRPYPPRSGVTTPPITAAVAAPQPAPAPKSPTTARLDPRPMTDSSVPAAMPSPAPRPQPGARSAAASEAVVRAHEAFLRTMGEAHRAFLETVSGGVLSAAGAPASRPAPIAPVNAVGNTGVAESPTAPGRARPMPAPPASRAVPMAVPATASVATAPAPDRVPAGPTGSAFDSGKVIELVLQTVAEKTGYPREMLEPGMQLESELGIDSIKRVEILSAVQKQLPGLPPVDAKVMSGLQSLQAISDYLSQQLGGSAGLPAVPATAPAPAPVTPAPAAFAPEQVIAIVLETVAEKTGYPREMLEPGMQLESDLGIDSIKRVEILSAVQKKLPGLPAVDAKVMSALQTLQAISDHLTEQLGGQAKPAAGTAARTEAAKAAEPVSPVLPVLPVLRYTLGLDFAEAPGLALAGLHRVKRLAITDDGRGIAEQLRLALAEYGISAQVVSTPPADCDGLILLEGLRTDSHPEAADAAHGAAFSAARMAAVRIAAAGGILVTVQDTGGRFGLGDGVTDRQWMSGFAGLAKTAAKEWPGAGVRSLDLECGDLSATQLGRRLADELRSGGDEREIGLDRAGRRHRLVLTAQPAVPAATPRWNSKSVVVASGGARGVTASALVALAKAHQPRIALLGRTPLAPEPASCAGLADEGALRQALIAAERSAGRLLTPKACAAAARDIMSQREIRATLDQLRTAGSMAEYFVCDTTDKASVSPVFAQVRERFGPITALVHGAGVLADKLIAEKTPEQFARVFDTKVRGLQVLLEATADDPLETMVLFSSVAGRFGNRGQSDYAMANEVLNKVAQAEFRRRGGRCLVRSIGWGPWNGGMVTPALREHFQTQGVGVIPHDVGAAAFVQELAGEARADQIEVVIGAGRLDLAADPTQPSHRVEVAVSLERYPFLCDHVVKGKIVVPFALVTEWLLQAAGLARPDQRPSGLRDLQVMKAVFLGAGASERVLLEVTTRPRTDGAVEIQIADAVSGQAHYRAVAQFGGASLTPLALNGVEHKDWRKFPFGAADAYDGRLFHGKELRVIRKLDGWSREAAAMTLENSALRHPEGTEWKIGPALLDGALQAAALWTLEAHGKSSLPLRIAELTSLRPARAGESVHCQLRGREQSGVGTVSDIDCVDASGEAIFALRGVECFQVDSYWSTT